MTYRPPEPTDKWPPKAKNRNEETNIAHAGGQVRIRLWPDEKERFWKFCSKRRASMSLMARTILLAYMDKMEAREGERKK